MPKKLDDCVNKLVKKGYSKNTAYAICSTSLGYKRKENDIWIKIKK